MLYIRTNVRKQERRNGVHLVKHDIDILYVFFTLVFYVTSKNIFARPTLGVDERIRDKLGFKLNLSHLSRKVILS